MPKTDVHCTGCGRELEPWEDVVIVMAGTVAPVLSDAWWSAQGSNNPYLEVLCSTCRERPNRVVVETERFDALTRDVRAERPDEVVVIVRSLSGGVDEVYGADGYAIKQLNTVKRYEDIPFEDIEVGGRLYKIPQPEEPKEEEA